MGGFAEAGAVRVGEFFKRQNVAACVGQNAAAVRVELLYGSGFVRGVALSDGRADDRDGERDAAGIAGIVHVLTNAGAVCD